MIRNTLPPELQAALDELPPQRRRELNEIRLRKGQNASLVFPWGQELLTHRGRPIPVTDKLLKTLVDRATNFSPYALKLEETGLYLPLEQGCRMGLCGEAVMRDGAMQGLRSLSSISIRVAQEHKGVASGAAKKLLRTGSVQSALIVSPPGGGKTTFLRDLIRIFSQQGYRVSVADERRELGAVQNGAPTLDLGPSTDILSGCPKAQAIPLLVRVMNPQILALDELGGQEELRAAQSAAFSGVKLLATAHGDSLGSLMRRPPYQALLASGAFDWCITLKQGRVCNMERLIADETSWSDPGDHGVVDERSGGKPIPGAASPCAPAVPAGPGAHAVGDGDPHGLCARAV